MEQDKRICGYETCTGCMACLNICPKDAIQLIPDNMNCLYPQISEDKCVDCGLCGKVCPIKSGTRYADRADRIAPPECYAIWSNVEHDRKTCSSGGIATALSRYWISGGGVVFGAAFDSDIFLGHRMVSDIEGLGPLKGSKYVQSNIGLTFRQCKSELENGGRVLFIGMPCQIAGLYGYLQKDYESLLTIDLICHGTPPQSYLTEYLKTIAPAKDIKTMTFRGEHDFCFAVYGRDGTLYCEKQDPYFLAFREGVVFRENCYKCPYANIDRNGDITLGDFWGLDHSSLEPPYHGKVSVMLLNSAKGAALLEKTSDLFTSRSRPLEEAVAGNDQLRRPFMITDNRRIFLKDYPKDGFNKTILKMYRKQYFKNRMKATVLGRILKKVLGR